MKFIIGVMVGVFFMWVLKHIQVASSPPEVNKVSRRGSYIRHDKDCAYLLPPPFDSGCSCGER